jgi:hypothetical protein
VKGSDTGGRRKKRPLIRQLGLRIKESWCTVPLLPTLHKLRAHISGRQTQGLTQG